MKKNRVNEIIEEVQLAVGRWEDFASDAGIAMDTSRKIGNAHIINLLN